MNKQTKFNRDDVIEKAKNLYWEKGYHATSMRNLQDVIDMRPGSIYAAFGSKENLFKETLNRYAQEGTEQLASSMAQGTTALGGLKKFVRNVTLCNKETVPNGMCMVVKSIAELTQDDNPDLLTHATTILNDVEASFARIFQQAIDNGEISNHRRPAELARYLQVQIMGFKTYVQATNNLEVIEKMIDDLFDGLH